MRVSRGAWSRWRPVGLAAVVAATAAAAGAGGCKDRTTGGPAATARDGVAGVGGPGAVGGVTVVDWTDAPDEQTLRRGKQTGLGGADERPAVATEALIEAIMGGRVPWSRWIDPARGVVELRVRDDDTERGGAPGRDPGVRDGDGAGDGDATRAVVRRRCGAALGVALDALASTMRQALASGQGHVLACDNLGLFVPDPDGAPAVALCSIESDAAGTQIIDLVFVPDADRGLRLVGVSTIPGEAEVTAALERFERELARTDARCP